MATTDEGSAVVSAEAWELLLSPSRHPGLFEGHAVALCASARVCMHRHHEPPTKLDVLVREGATAELTTAEQLLAWSAPSQRERNANLNHRDATRDGAYALALVCLERKMNLVTVGRAEDLTGADWYVAPPGRAITETGAPNLDDPEVMRLEVGGHDDRASLRYELALKVRQLEVGASGIPGVAVVVGFKRARVLVRTNVLSA